VNKLFLLFTRQQSDHDVTLNIYSFEYLEISSEGKEEAHRTLQSLGE